MYIRFYTTTYHLNEAFKAHDSPLLAIIDLVNH